MTARRPPAEAPRLYRIRQVAEITGLHTNTISRYCHQGRLRSVVINSRGDRLIPASEVDRLLALAEAGEPMPDRVVPAS